MEENRIKNIVIGEILAPPSMTLIGTGTRETRYRQWLKNRLMESSQKPKKPMNLIYLRACCHLSIIDKEGKANWHFSRKGVDTESSLEKVLHDFISNNQNDFKAIAPMIGVSWPKEAGDKGKTT